MQVTACDQGRTGASHGESEEGDYAEGRVWAGKLEGRELVVVVRWNERSKGADKEPGTRHRVSLGAALKRPRRKPARR